MSRWAYIATQIGVAHRNFRGGTAIQKENILEFVELVASVIAQFHLVEHMVLHVRPVSVAWSGASGSPTPAIVGRFGRLLKRLSLKGRIVGKRTYIIVIVVTLVVLPVTFNKPPVLRCRIPLGTFIAGVVRFTATIANNITRIACIAGSGMASLGETGSGL